MGARTAVAATLTALALLAGCGGEEAGPDSARESSAEPSETASPSDSASPTESTKPEPGADAPACGEVWREGARLPRAYKGCNETPGDPSTFVRRDVIECSSGQRMARHADHFYGVLGGTIHRTESRLLKDPGYGDAVARCRG